MYVILNVNDCYGFMHIFIKAHPFPLYQTLLPQDGVAIVLFQTLVHFLDESLVIDSEAVIAAAIHFFVIAFGSLFVGIGSGMACTFFYWAMYGMQTALVEVLMFFCWAFIPYYICDGIGWSGIVAVVATGFVMDIFVIGPHGHPDDLATPTPEQRAPGDGSTRTKAKRLIFARGHLSTQAKLHVGFVTEILATVMETAIFAYLGVFLFSYRYHWSFWHIFLSISACCLSRGIMIPLLSLLANWITSIQQLRANCRPRNQRSLPGSAGIILDKKMQIVLWFAGLRGAMSFALVETIPMYDTVTGEGSRLKPELKAMTSACIVFTVFLMGGNTFYLMDYLGIAPMQQGGSTEMTSLIKRAEGPEDAEDDASEVSYIEKSEDESRKIVMRVRSKA
jgi:NhaP-type Na+/H+ or K+/H+ antiporter